MDVLNPGNHGNFNIDVYVYTGTTLTGLTFIYHTDFHGSGGFGPRRFAVTAGQEYKFEVVSFNSSPADELQFTLSFTMNAKPPNDDFANAIVLANGLNDLSTGSYSVSGTLIGSSKETSEPNHASNESSYNNLFSVWYKFVAPASGRVSFNIRTYTDPIPDQSGGGIFIAAYTGTTLAGLVAVAKSTLSTTSISFIANLGTTYYIAIATGSNISTTSKVWNFNFAYSYGRQPSNDNLANAYDLGDVTHAVVRGSNINASDQMGEPFSSGTLNNSVWYKWRPARTGNQVINIKWDPNITTLGIMIFVGYDGIPISRLFPYSPGAGPDSSGNLNAFNSPYPKIYTGYTYFIQIACNDTDYGGDFLLEATVA
jgi:hypothetical protein